MKTLNCVQLVGPFCRTADGAPSLTTERWQRGADGQQHPVAEHHPLAPATKGLRVLLARLPIGTRLFVEGALLTGRGGAADSPPVVLVHTVVTLTLAELEAGDA